MTVSRPDPNATLSAEVKAHVDSLRELGPEYADAVAVSFMERVDKLIDAKIDARLAPYRGKQRSGGGRSLALPLALGIPLTAIAGGVAGIAGIIVVWLALVVMSFLFIDRR